jgi:D-alanyl-D-alanine carboxypeptidase
MPDLRIWVRALALGELLTPAMQRQRLDWPRVGPNAPARFYALGIFGIAGWLGHGGDIPGWTAFAMYNPELDASIVVTANADASFAGYAPASVLVKTATEVLFPNDVIDNGH